MVWNETAGATPTLLRFEGVPDCARLEFLKHAGTSGDEVPPGYRVTLRVGDRAVSWSVADTEMVNGRIPNPFHHPRAAWYLAGGTQVTLNLFLRIRTSV